MGGLWDRELQKLLLARVCTKVRSVLVGAVGALFSIMSLAVVIAVVGVHCLIDRSRQLSILCKESGSIVRLLLAKNKGLILVGCLLRYAIRGMMGNGEFYVTSVKALLRYHVALLLQRELLSQHLKCLVKVLLHRLVL